MNERMDTFVTKDDFDTGMDALAKGVDKIAEDMTDLKHECVAIKTQQNRHEERLVRLEQ
jgi:outer membrane murein-binding lipoprotein Lpp